MGCGSSSRPEVAGYDPRNFGARTETTETWDNDFKVSGRVSGIRTRSVAIISSSARTQEEDIPIPMSIPMPPPPPRSLLHVRETSVDPETSMQGNSKVSSKTLPIHPRSVPSLAPVVDLSANPHAARFTAKGSQNIHAPVTATMATTTATTTTTAPTPTPTNHCPHQPLKSQSPYEPPMPSNVLPKTPPRGRKPEPNTGRTLQQQQQHHHQQHHHHLIVPHQPKLPPPAPLLPPSESGRMQNNGTPNLLPSRRPPRASPPSTPARNSDRVFEELYTRGPEIGKGAFATVFIGIENTTQHKYAVKLIYDRNKMKWNNRDALMDEIGNLKKLRQAPHVVYLHDHFMTKAQCYLVLELLPGKELFERLIQKGTFTETETRDSCRCILQALDYMHERRMTHRDLKPENLLLEDELGVDQVKLSDFGFSKTIQKSNECRTLCGTPGYLAPEILERWPAYDVKCDVFSFGVILFLLLGGYLPFDSHGSNDVKKVFERTRNGQYYFYPKRWHGISKSAKDLVARCLVVNPSKRISAKNSLLHEWMGEGLALPTTQISSASLARTYEDIKLAKEKKGEQRDAINRLKELNDDFTVFLEEREDHDSIVSAMTGFGGKTVAGGLTVATFQTQFKEDGLSGLSFGDFYHKLEKLGQGGFAAVYRCIHKSSGVTYAVKEVNNTKLNKAEAETLHDEIVVLKYLRGAPYIIPLYDVFVDLGKTYMVLEEMKGGNLLQRICDKEVYTEREARELCKALFHAVNYCHKKHIAHRDIKLDNLLLQEPGNDATIKLADFGLAKKVKRKNGLSTMCGTPNYMAPEIFNLKNKGYDYRCDMWSVGAVVYCLLVGYLPFEGEIRGMADLIMAGQYYFHEEYWREISDAAKKLIEGLLQVDTNQRLSAEQALSSRWMGMDDEELNVYDLSLTKTKMKRMTTGKEKVKDIVHAIIGANKSTQATELANAIRREDPLKSYGMESSVQEEFDDCESELEILFDDVYEMVKQNGEGLSAKMHVAKTKTGTREFSVKKIVRRKLHPGDVAALNDEITVLREVADGGGNHVVCLHEVYEDPDATYLVLERIRGEVLIERVVKTKKYTEFDAKEFVRNLLLGVNHCHQKKIAIRNLTLDNLLLPPGKESEVIITDFEFAKKVLFPKSLRTQCGTQEFVAPEVLENRPAYDVSCDIWNVGVILFILLGGYYPFRGKDDEEVLRNVRYGNFEFRERFWSEISDDAKKLVRQMMTVNPDERVSVTAALTCSWIKADNSILSADLSDNVVEMKKELALKFKAAVKTVIATQKLEVLQQKGGPPATRSRQYRRKKNY